MSLSTINSKMGRRTASIPQEPNTSSHWDTGIGSGRWLHCHATKGEHVYILGVQLFEGETHVSNSLDCDEACLQSLRFASLEPQTTDMAGLLASISGGIFVAAVVLFDRKDSSIRFIIARIHCTDVESCPCPPSVQSCCFGVNTNSNSCAAAPTL
ncbi:hypothetical protein MUK42_32915 [Musa troglodytarum]|uniref:Uncharacterized protein n=1 Tax=Musa troglodytarum TaxID=320322 RepID=A0A9E7EW83_9LILI|nr:hypothetical protein MUK42_32915 [Musa troglodytarum]